MKSVSSFTYEFPGSPETSHKFPSVCIPDMAYTVEELMVRHRSGLLTDAVGGREPVWSEDADLDDVDMEQMMRSDIDVKHEFAMEGRKALQEMRKSQSDAAAKKAADDQEALVAARVVAAIAAKGTPPTT